MNINKLLLCGVLFLRFSQGASAEDLRQWCINSYPSRVEWCNSQYPDKSASPAAAPVAAAPELAPEPEPKVATREEPSEPAIRERRISSIHLADRSLAPTYGIGARIRTAGLMGCFRFSESEYRCVKHNSVTGRSAVVSAPTISGVSDGYMDRYCPTFIRGFKNRECAFDIAFTITAKGIDHMETTHFYGADHIELKGGLRQ